MSYQVFARKYRPQVFDDVLGQDHVIRTLKNAVLQRRLAHAYLFVGPRGTGKTSTARILAKSLNCIHGPTINPCGVCDSCREIAQGISLDVLEIDGASNNSVDQIRELRENVRFAPVRGRYKLYIIDEVHMLTAQAFNALLKTLEEPPEHVIFVFATTEPSRVPATILSRCQRFDLRRIPTQTIARHLSYIAEQEKIELTKNAAETIAVAAEGGLRDAESMLDQLVAFCGSRIDEPEVLEVFGLTSEQVVTNLAEAIVEGDSSRALSIIHQQSEYGKDLVRLLSDLLGFLRSVLIFKVDAGSLREEVSELTRAALEKFRDRISNDHLLRLIEQLSGAEPQLRLAANKKLNFELAAVKAIQSLREVGFDQVLDALEQLRRGDAGGGAENKVPPDRPNLEQSASEPARHIKAKSGRSPDAEQSRAETNLVSAPTSPETAVATVEEAAMNSEPLAVPLESFWREIRAQVQRRRPLISGWVDHATPLGLDAEALLLGFPEESALAVETLNRPGNRKFLEELVRELGGTARDVRMEIRPELARPDRSEGAPEQTKEDFRNDPLIQKALEIFKAEIEAPGESTNR